MTEPRGPRVQVSGVSFRFPGAPGPTLEGVDLDLRPGSFTALLGANGSGKSTLLRLLGGLLRPAAGEVRLRWEPPAPLSLDPADAPRAELARRLAYLPVRPLIPSDCTALEAVLLGRHPFGRGLLLERAEDLARAREALALALAEPFAARPCEELSSGERQRVLLARALCQETGLLLLDEPTSAQDPAFAQDVFRLLEGLAHAGRTVVIACHDLNAAARHADRLVLLAGGRVLAAGSPDEVLQAELLRRAFGLEAYLGRDGEVPYAVARGRAQP